MDEAQVALGVLAGGSVDVPIAYAAPSRVSAVSGPTESVCGPKNAMASDDGLELRFQEALGAHLFGEGKPHSVLEVKSPDISAAIYGGAFAGL
jgi:hypothetical protein